MEVDFQLLVKKILEDDNASLVQLTLTSSIIIRSWARKEKHELRWLAGQDGKLVDYDQLVVKVLHKYISENQQVKGTYITLEHFKKFIIEEFRKEIRSCFSCFMKLLKAKHHAAWKTVFNDLESRSAAWFYKRKFLYKEDNHSMFCESLESVFTKFINNELVFNDSCSFKSYFFKTLENKYFEFVKDPYRKKSVSLDSIDFPEITDQEGERVIELTERRSLLQKALNNLNHDERLILTEYFYGEKKLKEIASESGQTEENIRIKKYRALKKLFNNFKLMGYESPGS
jgi:RNA polymerase sigma-70 factor (ECF subfamily)